MDMTTRCKQLLKLYMTNCLTGKVSTIPKCPSAKCPLFKIWQSVHHGKVSILNYMANWPSLQSVFLTKCPLWQNVLMTKCTSRQSVHYGLYDKLSISQSVHHAKVSLTAKCLLTSIWKNDLYDKVSPRQSAHGKVSHGKVIHGKMSDSLHTRSVDDAPCCAALQKCPVFL